MPRTVAIVQSSYIPWKGYFDLINRADDFVLYDSVQFTRRDWRSRNRIKTANGPVWLSVPVTVRSREQSIEETEVADQKWRRKHWTSIELNYSKAPCFPEFAPRFRSIYLEGTETRLSMINRRFIETVNELLDIDTPLHWSSEFELPEERNERLVAICEQLNADIYLSGPNARDYLDVARFNRAGIEVDWMDYSGYPEYPQLHPPFDHYVSILDMIFNLGHEARQYMLTFAESAQ